jgi:ABC-type transport system substrate-binding protein
MFSSLLNNNQGAPYDPHSYLSSWSVPSHVEYSAIGNLDGSLTRDDLLARIEAVQKELNPFAIRDQWHAIMTDIHQQAIFLPLWGSRIPYVINRRLDGFVPPSQAFTYPIETMVVLDGSTTVTVAPGSGGALFKSVGPLNPHQYSPNQLFVNGWIYEGLVKYGQDGQILPALAESWDTENVVGGGQRVTFKLREGVTFHDVLLPSSILITSCPSKSVNVIRGMAHPITSPAGSAMHIVILFWKPPLRSILCCRN